MTRSKEYHFIGLEASLSWSYDTNVVAFTTICTISTYHHSICELDPLSCQCVLDTALCDKVCKWLATGLWFSLGTLFSSTNKTDCHDIT